MTGPNYAGGSLVNLIATLERSLTGSSRMAPLAAPLVPEAPSYLLMLLDGLGDHQLDHPDAEPLRAARVGAIDTVFPCTTTTALASLVTGMTPAEHGLLGYEMWLPEAGRMVNTIHWTPVGGGEVVDVDFDAFLPGPNLWERLAAADVEPITVQPAIFAGTPLSRVLYRGCRYEPVETYEDWIEASVGLAAEPGRLVFSYFGAIDVAAHLKGQDSEEYAGALRLGTALWDRLVARRRGGAAIIGTADHGHVDVVDKVRLDDELAGQVYGGGRVMFARADISHVAAGLPARWVDGDTVAAWFGPGERHPRFTERAPAGALVAEGDARLLHRHSDKRLIGVHGAPSDRERRVPVLIG